jgi:nucleotide-binding universal stress UspA family protein
VEAREAILAALGTSACLVSSDPLMIDGLLAETWPGEPRYTLRLAAILPAGPLAAELAIYAGNLGGLLGASVVPTDAAGADGGDWDLTIMPAPVPFAGMLHVLPASAGGNPRAVLVVRQPRWPVRHVLLVMNGAQVSEAALAWALRLARPSAAALTLLAIAPPQLQTGGESLLYLWLSTLGDAAVGRYLRRIARLVVDAGIQGRLRLRQGEPGQEIGREVAEEEYDLIVMGTSTENGSALVGPAPESSGSLEVLLRQEACPVLIA